ncbi:unnamed protein product [Brachionus calyciflorus]|uniref:Uncharacterized protein n=1 Tax=Brachionus calyciflorus TaxID=104777 RepID=A0A813UBP7_9BILA|nr:unnamed protein product [Brachionus calyciflorus]
MSKLRVISPTFSDQSNVLKKKEIMKTCYDEEEMKKQIKECVREWCENTTSHGFSNMVKTDSNLIRVSWVVLVLCFSSYCLYTVINSINSYLAYEVSVNYQIVADSSAEFPAVTICNLNPFDVAAETSTGEYIIQNLKSNSMTPVITTNNGQVAYLLVDDAANILKATVNSDKNLTRAGLEKLGFTLDTMLISCYYDHDQCNSSNFTWFHDSEFGNCYTFNALFDENNNFKEPLVTSKTGPVHGLNLELFVGAGGAQDYYTVKKGVKVAIHQRGVRPIMKYEGVYVGIETAAHIGFSRTNYSKQPYPYNNCRKDTQKILATDSLYFNYTLKLSKYSQKLCYEFCMQFEQIVPNCGCADPRIPIVDSNLNICHNKSSLACVKSNRDHFDHLNIAEICDKHCPYECDSLVFMTTVSTASYPTDYYANLLMSQDNIIRKFNPKNVFVPEILEQNEKVSEEDSSEEENENDYVVTRVFNTISNQTVEIKKKPTDIEIKESILMLSIYYDDLRYLYVKESPSMSFDTLMGIVGGQFGLYLGASFLSFVEIVEMLVNISRIVSKYKLSRRSFNLN